jgi:hypothetical protein
VDELMVMLEDQVQELEEVGYKVEGLGFRV